MQTVNESLHSPSRENMFSVKSLNLTRLVAVLRPGPPQPSPVPSDLGERVSGVPLGDPLLFPEALFFGFRSILRGDEK